MAIIVDSVSPVEIRLVISTVDTTLDLTTVTSVGLAVRPPRDGNSFPPEVAWTTTIVSATVAKIIIAHPLVAGDVPRAGTYTIAPTLVTSSGNIPCDPVDFPVLDKFG